MTDDQRMKLPFLRNGAAQIALVVKDLDTTVENYYKLFGIGPWHFYTYGAPLLKTMRRRGEDRPYTMRLALSSMGPTRIELIEQLEGDTVYSEFIEKHGYGLHHIGVLTDDMEESMRLARECGFEVTQEGAGFGPDGDGHFAYLDTEETLGFIVELIQRPKRRNPPDKIYPPEE